MATDFANSRNRRVRDGRAKPAWPWLPVSLLTMAASASAPAAPSPGEDITLGQAVFTGAASADSTAQLVAPAFMLLGFPGTHVYIAGASVASRRQVDLAEQEPAGEWLRSQGGTFGLWSATSQLGLGLTVYSPDPAWRLPTNQATAAFADGGMLRRTSTASLSAAWRYRRVLAGVRLSLQRTTMRLRYIRDSAAANGDDAQRGIASPCGDAPCGYDNALARERWSFDLAPNGIFSLANLAWNFNVGVELGPNWWLAVTYQTSSLGSASVALRGTATIETAPRDGGGVVEANASLDLPQPSRVDAELRGPVGRGTELALGAHWTDLSALAALDLRTFGRALPSSVPEWQQRALGFHDETWTYVGLETIDFGQPWRLGARILYFSDSLSAGRASPLATGGHGVGLGLGAKWRLRPTITLGLSYGFNYSPARTSSAGQAFDNTWVTQCSQAGYDYAAPACARARDGYAIGNGLGSYREQTHFLRLGLTYDLR